MLPRNTTGVEFLTCEHRQRCIGSAEQCLDVNPLEATGAATVGCWTRYPWGPFVFWRQEEEEILSCNFNLIRCCLVAQSCLTFCDPTDWSPPGSSVHGISQARTLEWAAISFSRGSSRLGDGTCISRINRWILYHWATSALNVHQTLSSSPIQQVLFNLLPAPRGIRP